MVVRRLSINSELTALLASGMSLTRFTRPLFVLGFAVTALNVGILGWIEPWARYVYREVRFHVENVSPYLAATEGQFMKIGNQTILVEHIDKRSQTFNKVFLFEPKPNGGSTEVLASKGEMIVGNGRVALLLHNGTRLKIAPPKQGQEPNPEYLDFETLTFPLTSEHKAFRAMGDDEQEFSLVSLYRTANSPPQGTMPQEMLSELHRKLVIILSSLFLPLLATSFARANMRGRNAFQGLISFGFLIVYQQLVQFGSILTDQTGLSPALTMWPIFIVLVVAALGLLFLQDTRAGAPIERLAIAWSNSIHGVRSWFAPPPPRRPRRPRQTQGRPMTRAPSHHQP